jgi:DNA-binding SARP family transcriptional activator
MRRGSSPGSLFVNLLGGFQLAGPRTEDPLRLDRKKTRALLAVLALVPGRLVPRGKLMTLLWEEHSEPIARHRLRQCLLDVRQALARCKVDAIRIDGDLIGLEPSRVIVDVSRFEQLVAESSIGALEEALALYRGDLLEGLTVTAPSFEDWLQIERERLRTHAVNALRTLLEHYVGAKVADGAVRVALRLLELEPFDESAHRALIRLYAESGRRSAALRQYEQCVETLRRELGADPVAETRELYRRLVSGRAESASVPAIGRSPRKPASPASKVAVVFASSVGTPLIGRDVELTWLEELQKRAECGQPQLALLVGEAGIGKTRLVGELASRTQHRRIEVLVGRGREGEDVLPFAPWIEAVRPALTVELLGRLAPVTRLDLARLFPEVADVPSPPPSGIEDGPRIFEAVAHVLRQTAAGHPLVIVLEDLHWCDDMTVRLLKFLPRRLEGQAVLLVGTARVEEITGGSERATLLDALRRDPSCTPYTLSPLSRDEATRLLRSLLASSDEMPAVGLTERMWRLSEGNPFVVVECARAIRDHPASRPESWLELPDQVRELTARCFVHLSEGAACLADAAAVIGRDFDVAVLRHAARLTESEVANGVEELVRRGVFRELGGGFDFRHDRVREVAYGHLLGPRRALLHRQVAEALETVYAAEVDGHSAAIGGHYREAGVWEQASTYLASAGFQAWERGAGREAMVCFEDALRAIARLPDTEERRELHVHLRLVANGASVATGSYERGRPHLLVAEKLAGTLSDPRWIGRVSAALSNSYRAAGVLDHALRLGRRALDVAMEAGDRGLESAARCVLGMGEHIVGNFRASVHQWPSLLSDDARCPDLRGPFIPHIGKRSGMRAMARYWIALNYVQLGEFDAGMRLVSESFGDSDAGDDPLGSSRLLANISLGKLHNARGDFEAAVRAYEAALAIYRQDCHAQWYRPLSWGLGLAYALAGRVREGVDLLERADAAERAIGSNTYRPMRLLHFGRALIEASRIDEAALNATEALRQARDEGNRPAEAGSHGLLGEVARLRDPVDREAMERHILEALTLAEMLEMRPLAARCHLRLAALYEGTRQRDRNVHAAAAKSLIQQMGEPRSLDAAGVH